MDGKPFEPKRGWDVGERPTVPMPYFRLPEHKFVEAHLRRAPPGAPELRRPPECRDLEFSSREPAAAHVEMHARRDYQRRPGSGWLSKLHPKTLDYRTAAWSSAVWAVPQLGSCASTGHTWRLWAARYSQGKAVPLGAQPLPWVLELAASKAADSTAFDHAGTVDELGMHPDELALDRKPAEEFPTLRIVETVFHGDDLAQGRAKPARPLESGKKAYGGVEQFSYQYFKVTATHTRAYLLWIADIEHTHTRTCFPWLSGDGAL
jgi:hypothetical protein